MKSIQWESIDDEKKWIERDIDEFVKTSTLFNNYYDTVPFLGIFRVKNMVYGNIYEFQSKILLKRLQFDRLMDDYRDILKLEKYVNESQTD